MNMKLGILLAAAAVPLAGQSCPAIRFLAAPERQVYLPSQSAVAGLARQTDGSLTEQRYKYYSPYQFLGTTSGILDTMLQCTSLGSRTPSPASGSFYGDLLGIASGNPVITDLKGNGTPTVVGLFTGNNLSVHFPNPSAPNAPATNYTLQPDVWSVLVADFNSDGKRDAAVVHNSESGFVSVLPGNGDGTLKPPVTYPVGSYPSAMTAYDFNGDGRPDLAVANGGSQNISILFANANGTFQPATTVSTGGNRANAIVAADVTGDGKVDLLAATFTSVLMLRGNGNGTFQAPTTIAPDMNPFTLATGDFNHDGKLDIAVADSNAGRVNLLLGANNGTFTLKSSYAVRNNLQNIFATDFDRDGKLDIVIAGGHPDGLSTTAYGNYYVTALPGNGDGTFYAAPAYSLGGDPTAVIAADLNGDGKPDIAVSNWGVDVLMGQGGGTLASAVHYDALDQYNTPLSLSSIVAGDFNKDGKVDIAGPGYLFRGNGNGTFQAATTFEAGPHPGALAAGDLNNDSKLDLVSAQGTRSTNSGQTTVVALLGNGSGGFAVPVPYTSGTNPVAAALADLNGDGKLDLVAVNNGSFGTPANNGGVAVLLGNGNGTFQTAVSYAVGVNPAAITIGDLNGDGKPDLVVATSSTVIGDYQLGILLGNGNGSFQQATFVPTDFGPQDVLIGDFNGDGKVDLIVSHCCGDTDMTYLLGNGNGTFQSEVHFAAGASPGHLVAADLNSDGRPDFVSGNSNASLAYAAVFLNLVGGIAPTCNYSVNRSSFTAAAAGDVLSVSISASASSCSWTGQTGAAWLSVTPGTGQGSGAVRITAEANNASVPRTGVVTVAGQTLTVVQAAASCSISLSAQTATVGSAGSTSQVTVSTGPGCSWTPAPDPDWITIPGGPSAVIGPAGLSYTVASNSSSSPRPGSISVAGQILQIIQKPASPAQIFDDVPLSHPFVDFLTLMKQYAITSGCTGTSYCPDGNTTRGEMAVFIVRGLLGTDSFSYSPAPYFTDVAATHPFFKFIQKMKELGITSGCTASTYCPDEPVTRGQMAVFIVRARFGLTSGQTFPVGIAPYFGDVAGTHAFFSFIQKMKELGITSGCTATTYCPDATTTRGQMGVFIIRGLRTP
ncbi:MAG: VCBS repeat-containing protein [Bryobacterales bacterium]|nr:VCBS repeat-containing protein [Bryobacterales bacterium]